MSETSVIKEFLVALGFRTDEAALKNFQSGIDKASKAVFGLAAAIETTAVGVAAGVARWASGLEALYFASIRTGSSAASLKAFDRAAQDFGASAGEALGSVEGLAHALRENPFGTEGLLKTMGVQTRDANGHLRETRDLLMQTHDWFSRMPTNVGLQRAAALGVSEQTYLALKNNDFLADYQKKLKEFGPNWERTVRDAHSFMDDLRDLETLVEAFGIRIQDALQRKFGVNIKSITQWLQKHGDKLADRVVDAVTRIVDSAEWLGRKIGELIDKFVEWDTATNGWSTRLIAFGVLLKVTGGAEIIGGVLSLAAAFVNLGRSIEGASVAAGGLGIIGKLGALGAALGAGYGIGTLISNNLSDETNNKIGEFFQRIAGSLGIKSATEAFAVNNPLGYLSQGSAAQGYFTKEQAAGILANLQAESDMNPSAVGDHGHAYGLAQWQEPGQRDFAAWAGHDIRQSTAAEQLDFLRHDMTVGKWATIGRNIQDSATRQQAARVMSLQYERPAGGQTEADRRAAAAVHVTSQTTVHVTGSGNPQETAREVASQQRGVNANLTRSFVAVVQ